MGSTATGRVSRGATAIWVVAIALLLVAGAYLGFVWLESARFLAGMSEIEDELSETISRVNADTSGFQGDPGSAAVLVDSVREARNELADLTTELERLRMPPPPAADPALGYREAVLGYTQATADYFARLESVATVVVDRAEIVDELSDGLGVLTELSDPEATVADIGRVVAQARRTVEDAVAAVEQVVAAAGPSAYSSDALLARLRGLADALAEIEGSLDTQDAARLSNAAEAFSRLIAAEWAPLFFEASQEGVEAVAGDIEGLVSVRTEIDESRASLDQMRGRFAFVAIAFAVVAVLLLAALRLR